jgi:hypothetical protein
MEIETGRFRKGTVFGKDSKDLMKEMRVEEVFHCRETGVTELYGARGVVYIFQEDRKALMEFWKKQEEGTEP